MSSVGREARSSPHATAADTVSAPTWLLIIGNAYTRAFGWIGSPTSPARQSISPDQAPTYGAVPSGAGFTPAQVCTIVGLPAQAAATTSDEAQPAACTSSSTSAARPSRTAEVSWAAPPACSPA